MGRCGGGRLWPSKTWMIRESKKTRVRDSGGCEKPNSLSRLGRWRFVTGKLGSFSVRSRSWYSTPRPSILISSERELWGDPVASARARIGAASPPYAPASERNIQENEGSRRPHDSDWLDEPGISASARGRQCLSFGTFTALSRLWTFRIAVAPHPLRPS